MAIDVLATRASEAAATATTERDFLEYHEPDSMSQALLLTASTILSSILSSSEPTPTSSTSILSASIPRPTFIIARSLSSDESIALSSTATYPQWIPSPVPNDYPDIITSDAPGRLTAAHPPTVISLLILISFFFFLSFAEWFSDKIFRAGLIGQIIVGLIYGLPLGNIMPIDWQETFVSLGYIGLILIIFEGGLTVRLDLLKKNFLLSFIGATVGVITPIGLCYALLYVGFGYGAIETFIIGAALSTTSLGTTFVVIGSAAKGMDFAQTKVGIVLISAAVFDDVSGLVMASVIHNLGSAAEGNINIGWLIGRPIVASAALGIFSPLIAKYLASPFFRWYIEDRFARYKHVSNIVLMVLVLSAFLSIAAFAGTSVLFGSFMAGTFLSSLPCTHPDAPFMVMSREHGEEDPGKTPTFIHTFEKYFLGAQTYILQPMFFASIGFAIPFKRLWTGRAIWRGVVFSLLMLFGKVVVGAVVPMWDKFSGRKMPAGKSFWSATWPAATLLGMAMVARGEIGLLIIQVGLNETPYLSEDAFITAAWAIVLNTIIGPVAVGLLIQRKGRRIAHDERWGIQMPEMRNWATDDLSEDGKASRWTSRRHSRSVSRPASLRSRNTSRSQSRAASLRSQPRGRTHSRPPSEYQSSVASPTSPTSPPMITSGERAINPSPTVSRSVERLSNPALRSIEFDDEPRGRVSNPSTGRVSDEIQSARLERDGAGEKDLEKGMRY
ncbi:hypothetical protein MKZ38_007748 [Zalerion maritima]|uniref:Cation/H+ exchanger transmembrane domain-containing protein n=1 Tax=Zalerion maritima TaxID=339359 RepID=A0AAD5WP12_9PEZI|nr:hypothetical protein MKZ38_007748 [Zalerion maritima]